MKRHFHKGFVVCMTLSLLIAGCGGGASSASNTLTPAQVAAITPEQIASYKDQQITALGENIKYLSDAALQALYWGTNGGQPVGQIQSISAAQIAVLSPAQVRMIGAAGAGGSVGTSQIQYLNSSAWMALVSDPLQVAAITANEIPTLWDSEIVTIGTNIQYLSDVALNALTWSVLAANSHHNVGQIQSLTVAQINTLSPAQVRMLGAAGPGGSVGTAQIQYLNTGAWEALIGNSLQVAEITLDEMATFTADKVIAFDTNISLLTDAALGSISFNDCSGTCASPIASISAAQIAALSPAQIGIIANIVSPFADPTTIAFFNSGAFAALGASQVAVLIPENVTRVTASQLASLSTSTLAGFAAGTSTSFTAGQTSLLSAAQQTACGC